MFCDTAAHDFHLSAASPCAPANNSCGVLMGALDVGCGCANGTIHVPTEYATIQAGIDAACDGDTVLVADGTYAGTGNVNINFNGKAIVVMSENGPESTIIDCESSSRGVSFVSDEDSTTELSGFTITRGRDLVAYTGAGIYAISASPRIINCILLDNYVNLGNGGGLYCDSSDIVLSNCQFLDNNTDGPGTGGGIYCKSSSLRITSCLFDHNLWSGGAIYSVGSQLIIDSCEFTRNCLSGSASGGVLLANSSADISHCTFEGNKGYWGGAMSIGQGSSIILTECSFSDNFAENGPAILSEFSDIVATDCVFDRNRGYLHTCGAVSARGSNVEFLDCVFSRNTAEGIPKSGSDPKDDRGGGALNLWSGSDGLLVNCSFIENSIAPSPFYGGGAVSIQGSAATIDNCTFYGNSDASEGGGIVQCISSSPAISNSIFAFNAAGRAISCEDSVSFPILTCTDIYGNTDGDWVGCISDQAGMNGNLSADPMFCDAAALDFHLNPASPCAPANNSCGVLIGAFDVGCNYLCGDADDSGMVDIDDAVYLIAYVYMSGPMPEPPDSGDVNCDSKIDLLDIVRIVNYLFRGGYAPCDIDGNGTPDCG